MKPKRIQRKRARGWKMPPNTIYVGRPTIWGNPFRITNGDCDHPDCGPRSHPALKAEDVVEAYRRYLPGLLQAQPGISLEQLRGKNLACWCPLDQPCHADVLLEIANRAQAGFVAEHVECSGNIKETQMNERNFTVIAIGKNGKTFNLGTHSAEKPIEAIRKAREKNETLAMKAVGEIKSFEVQEDFL